MAWILCLPKAFIKVKLSQINLGLLAVAETIVWVGAVADHRGQAISACEYMMDTLKTDAPFWKREQGPAGEQWVASRASDSERRARWQAREAQ